MRLNNMVWVDGWFSTGVLFHLVSKGCERWDVRWRFDILLAVILKRQLFHSLMEQWIILHWFHSLHWMSMECSIANNLLCHNGVNGANGVQAPSLYSIGFWIEQIYTKALFISCSCFCSDFFHLPNLGWISNLGNEKWEQNGHNIRLVSISFLIKKGNEWNTKFAWRKKFF